VHLQENVSHFQKQLVPTVANFASGFLSVSFLQVGQLNSYGVSTDLVNVKMIAEFITNVQYLVETLLSKEFNKIWHGLHLHRRCGSR